MDARLAVRKTYKLFIGGAFVRSESGRVAVAKGADGTALDHYSAASRKDFRDAVTAARGAFAGWAGRTAYLRSQILYRAAEMLQQRIPELAAEIERATGNKLDEARTETLSAVDRLVYYAGWADKFSQVFGAVNPVASAHFNFTVPEATGVVVTVAPDAPSLLGLISVIAPALVAGNSVVALASEASPLVGLTLSEVLATSDLPAGSVNILTGRVSELASHLASHMDVNAIVDGGSDADVSGKLHAGTAVNLKRYVRRAFTPEQWSSAAAENPYWILDTVEHKTAWHPIGL